MYEYTAKVIEDIDTCDICARNLPRYPVMEKLNPGSGSRVSLGEVQAFSVAVREQSLLSHLTSVSAIFHASEESTGIRPLKDVDPYTAGFQTARDTLGIGEVLGVYGSTETGVAKVRPLDDIVFVRKGEDREDGA